MATRHQRRKAAAQRKAAILEGLANASRAYANEQITRDNLSKPRIVTVSDRAWCRAMSSTQALWEGGATRAGTNRDARGQLGRIGKGLNRVD